MTTIASLALAILAATGSGTDTTMSVPQGTRLELENFSGEIVVETWTRNAVRVQAAHARRTEVDLDLDGPVLSVSARGHMGVPATVDYQLTVPAWMALELSGIGTDVTVRGAKGGVEIETIKGDVSIEGGSGRVNATSIEGSVHVESASGSIEVSSVNEGVWLSGVTGPITASSVNGHVVITSMQSTTVEASTVNGTVVLTGALRPDGTYHLSSHNGDLMVGIAEKASVTVSVSTYQGELRTGFPVTLEDSRKSRRYRFTLGKGEARLELETFQGTVLVDRPGVIDREADGLRQEAGYTRSHSSSSSSSYGKSKSTSSSTSTSKSTSKSKSKSKGGEEDDTDEDEHDDDHEHEE